MKEKLCKFTDQEWNILERVKSENNLSSDAAALRHVLADYQVIKTEMKNYESIAGLVSERLIAHYKSEILGMLHSSRAAEKNTSILVEAINTMLFHNDIKSMILTDELKSPVIKAAELNYHKKIGQKKQKKDFINIKKR